MSFDDALTQIIGRRVFVTGLLSSVALMAMGPAFAENAKGDAATVVRNYNQPKEPPSESRVILDPSVPPMLTSSSERLMYDAIARYEIYEARGAWPNVEGIRSLRSGSAGPAVTRLRQRLAAEGYLPHAAASADTFDADVVEAVERFQIAHGLRASGRTDKATLRELAVPAAKRLATLRANLPRVQEYSKKLGARYIVVNIPATQLDSVENGKLFSRHKVIVGKVNRPSPVLESQISELNFNPYWNAPVSIVRKDIIPQVRKDFGILKKLDIKIYDGYNGPEVDPKTIDWETLDPQRYHFRQEPGEENAMASVKINFPNKYAVYMHDTPTKTLFNKASRYFSSGCVRVDQVHVLTNWILNGQDGWDEERIEQVKKSGERLDVAVWNKPQLRFAYLTAWVTEDGLTHFRDDIYNLDGTGFVAGQPEGPPEESAS